MRDNRKRIKHTAGAMRVSQFEKWGAFFDLLKRAIRHVNKCEAGTKYEIVVAVRRELRRVSTMESSFSILNPILAELDTSIGLDAKWLKRKRRRLRLVQLVH